MHNAYRQMQPPPAEAEAVDERSAAKLIGVSPRTVFTLRTTGELPHIKVRGRVLYLRDDIRSFLERSRQS